MQAALLLSLLLDVVVLAGEGRSPSFPSASVATRAPSIANVSSAQLRVSQRLTHEFLRRDVQMNEAVAETIHNMTTRGTARVECHLGVEFVPDRERANIRLRMHGQAVVDDAVGTQRAVTVYSSSRTQISAVKDSFFGADGIGSRPTTAQCRTSIDIQGISANRRLIERIAWRRVGKLQPSAESMASQSAARRAEQHMEREVRPLLADMQKGYVEKLSTFHRQGSPGVHLSTTADHLSIELRERGPARTPIASPGRTPPAQDVSLVMHESAVASLAQCQLAGKTLTDQDVLHLVELVTGRAPPQLWVHARTDSWSIVAAQQRPLTVAFADNQATIALCISAASRSGAAVECPLEFSATYALEATADGPVLARRGSLNVRVLGDRSATNRQNELRDFLTMKLSGLFQPEIHFDGLVPPQGGSWGKLRRLQLSELTAASGWLRIGYELSSSPKPNRPMPMRGETSTADARDGDTGARRE